MTALKPLISAIVCDIILHGNLNLMEEVISVKVSTGPAQSKKGARKRPCKQQILQGSSDI